MNTVKGKNIAVAIFDTDSWFPVLCGKSRGIEKQADEIEVTNINSGRDKDFIPGMNSSTLSMTGVTTLDNTNGRISPNYLMQQMTSGKIYQMRMVQTDDDGGVLVAAFNAFNTNVSISGEIGPYSQSSITFRICGPIAWGSIIAPPVAPEVFSDYWNTTPGTSVVSGVSVEHSYTLIGKTIIGVYREGTEYDLVLGTPVGRKSKYTDPTVVFDASLPFNPGEQVFLIFTA